MSAHHEQSGSALILAIAFILAMGLGITTLLSFLYAGMNASTVVREQGGDLYAVDAAVESTIARLRVDKLIGVDGTACGPFVETVNGRVVTVACTPGPDSRESYTVGGGGGAGLPEGALIALGTGGIDVQINSPETLTIGADVLSNGPVTVDNGTLAVDGTVYAPLCGGSGRLVDTASPPVDQVCDPTKPATDPEYDLPVSQPPAQALGSHCDGAAVPEGTYTNAQAWKDLVADCNGTLTFDGVYYLAFTDAVSCSGTGTIVQWCIENNQATLVAGIDPNDPAAGCSGDGAVFVLGGDTRITARAGTLLLCGETMPDGSIVSVYAKSPPPAAPPSPDPMTVTLSPTVAKSTGNPSFADPSNALTIGGGAAAVAYTQNGSTATKTAAISLSSFAPLPAGAVVSDAKLNIVHNEAITPTDIGSLGLSVTTGGVTTTYPSGTTTAPTWQTSPITETIDLTTVLPSAAAIADASVTFSVTATLPKGSTLDAVLDGIALDVTYVPSAVPVTPWGTLTCSAPPCTVLDTDGSNTRASFLGTIYTPESRVALKAVNLATAAAGRGIIARTISIHVPTLVDPDSFHITVEGGGAGTTLIRDGQVRLVASLDGRPRLSTDVSLPEGDGSLPTAVTIANWTIE